jgi:N-glycosylase/DNA lyase
MKGLFERYELEKKQIRERLRAFYELEKDKYFQELLFCLLTPQSNAKKCWDAVEKISWIINPTSAQINSILKTRTRFHNNKTRYILEAYEKKENILSQLNNRDRIDLRNWLAKNVKGFGLKEASHFLRNIGKSENQVAILDRHILRNLKALNLIAEDKIKNTRHYLEIENKFKSFSKEVKIPIDELDLLFWSGETGEIFK